MLRLPYAVGGLIALSGLSAIAYADTDSTQTASTDASPFSDGGHLNGSVVAVAEAAPTDPKEDTPSDPDRPRSLQSRFVEEIVVTAQKRDENINDVPISIAAFSADRLEAAGVESTQDLQLVTPGLSYSGVAGFNLVYLRGVGTSAYISSFDPSVATYVDGIYVPAQQGALTDLAGVERVEVLKGPQGTLFGRNSTGGAISVTTLTPTFDRRATLQAEVGNYEARKAKAYFNTPLTDSIAANLAAIYSSADNYYDLVDDPNDLQPRQNFTLMRDVTRGARVKLLWQATEDLKFELSGYDLKQTGSSGLIAPIYSPSLVGNLAGVRAVGDYETNNNVSPYSQISNRALYGNMNWSLPWFDTKLLAGHQSIITEKIQYDFDGSQSDLVAFTTPNAPNRLQTAELQFVSNDRDWNVPWLTWAAGVYYLHQEAGYDPLDIKVLPRTVNLTPDGPIFGAIPSQVVDFLNQANIPIVGPLLDLGSVSLLIDGILETNSYSAFVQTTVDFTDWLGLTLGGRYTKEDRFLTKSQVGVPGLESVLVYHQPKVDQSNFSPKASLNFRFADDTLAYLIYSRGFKSGSYNIVSIYTPPQYVEPEKATAYEAGVKTALLDKTLRLNAAIFRTDIDDMQEQYVSLLSGGAVQVENAASARSEGVEFDVVWTPMPDLNPGLAITGGATILDAKYRDYPNASGFNDQTGVIQQNLDFSGNEIPRAAKKSGTFAVSQTVELGSGSLEASADVYYSSGFYFTNQNSEVAKQDSYELLNARLSYLYDPWGLRVTAFAQNLLDEKYANASVTLDFGTTRALGSPRTYGLRAQWDFGW